MEGLLPSLARQMLMEAGTSTLYHLDDGTMDVGCLIFLIPAMLPIVRNLFSRKSVERMTFFVWNSQCSEMVNSLFRSI